VKGDRLGEFEELTLLALSALRGRTHAVPIQQFVEQAAGRNVSMGATYAALVRLEAKGFARSTVGEPSPVPGGKRKRLYDVTPLGAKTLRDLRRVRERIWQTIEAGRR
jgi:PadR family transcriptional regulator, regulatory protein PadR